MTGFVIFLLSREEVYGQSNLRRIFYIFRPVCVAGLCLVIAGFLQTFVMKKKILTPVVEIAQSADAIVRGDYEHAVLRTHSQKIMATEIDSLIYGFERMRDELQNKEEKEKKLKRAQKELMSCISHDLKTPISTIKAYGEGLRDGLARDERTQREYVSTIIQKADVMTTMIQELLDQNNAEINELTIHKEETYIESYFDKIFRELQVYVSQRGCKFTFSNQVTDMLVGFDRGRITQVIYNLVDNAIKYMDKEEGSIFMQTSYHKEQKMIYVTIKDNGPGISIMDIPYVFDKFYRAEKSRSTSIPGAGLGLIICKYIVEAHGGEITLESQNGKGCVFTFSLMV